MHPSYQYTYTVVIHETYVPNSTFCEIGDTKFQKIQTLGLKIFHMVLVMSGTSQNLESILSDLLRTSLKFFIMLLIYR